MRARDFDRDEFLSTTWPEALESGEFKQAKGHLKTDDGYCCLGVGCELLSRLRLLPRSKWQGNAGLPEKASKLLGIDAWGSYLGRSRQSLNLAADNDAGKSFKQQIAKTIRSVHRSRRFESPSASD